MNKLDLPYNRQYIDNDDIQAVVKALKSDFLTTGPEVDLFEKDIAKYCGSKYAVVCANGTAALHLALMSLSLNKEDAVLTTPITFIADANVALLVGAQIIFSDVRKDNANLDIESIRHLLKTRPEIKVIIPVHFAGHPVDIQSLNDLANEFGVTIIEDACHALGASYFSNEGKEFKVGSCKHSSMTIFSFHPIKSITTGEGGVITTNDNNLYKKILRLRSHGTTRDKDLIVNKELGFSEVNGGLVANSWYYEMQDLSHNYRISDFQCALGRSQLLKLEKFIRRREHLCNIYRKEILHKIPNYVTPLSLSNNVKSAHHLFVVRINFIKLGIERAELMIFLQEYGVQTQVNYMPVYLHPYYQNYFKTKIRLIEAENYFHECLSLPLFFSMKDTDPIDVIELLAKGINTLKN
jgi:UDP-4-amino-4,6-dideoxy-N-acetyl-beta-L-altrosamine transaminase